MGKKKRHGCLGKVFLFVVVCALLGALVYSSPLKHVFLKTFIYPVHHEETIEYAAKTYDVDPDFICAVIKTESNWQDDAKSSAGALGLMQIMPLTAQELAQRKLVDARTYPPEDIQEPTCNIVYGTAYLHYLQQQTSSLEETLAAYNAGPGVSSAWSDNAQAAQQEFKEAVTYPETKEYIENVMRAMASYQELYPEGIQAHDP